MFIYYVEKSITENFFLSGYTSVQHRRRQRAAWVEPEPRFHQGRSRGERSKGGGSGEIIFRLRDNNNLQLRFAVRSGQEIGKEDPRGF